MIRRKDIESDLLLVGLFYNIADCNEDAMKEIVPDFDKNKFKLIGNKYFPDSNFEKIVDSKINSAWERIKKEVKL